MTQESFVKAYKDQLGEDLEKYEDLKSKAERKIALIKRKLANPERAFNQELKDGSGRARAIMGQPVPVRKSNLRIGKVGIREEIVEDPSGMKSVRTTLEIPKTRKGFFESFFEEDEE